MSAEIRPSGAWDAGPQRSMAARGRAVAVVAVAALLAAALAGGSCAAEPSEPKAPPPPAAPAFYTFSVSRIRNIRADGFDFMRDDDRRLKVRLAFADCTAVPDRLRGHAETVARSLLEAGPVWVFPCGRPKGAADEVWACVWTEKGWLAEVLIRAGYAVRRKPPEADALEAFDPAGTSNAGPLPAGGAFASAGCKPVDGDTYDVQQAGGKSLRVRLYDVACQDAGDPPHTAATAAAEGCIGPAPVWVFPCYPARSTEEPRVRLWTRKGWLAQVLLNGRLATSHEDPLAAAVAKPGPPKDPAPATPDDPKDPDPASAKRPHPKGTPVKPEDLTWRPITVTAAKVSTGGMQGAETEVFSVPSGIWRVSWQCKPPKAGFRVLLNVYRVDEKWTSRVSSHHVTTLKGETGSSVLQTGPGQYWIKLACSADVDKIKVEVGEPPKE